jgi:hypothetical protein
MTSYPNAGIRALSDTHRRMLYDESGIDPGVAAERGYYTARLRSEVPEVFKEYQRRRGLVVPMYSPDGETVGYQLRPDRPRKGGPKYETPGRISPVVDVHPRMLEEVRHGDSPLLITEGGKTGDAATSRGIPTVVLAGVWGWCKPKVKPYQLRPCFDHVRLEGRRVFVAFDSDCMSKASVQDALAALVTTLKDRGASVKAIYLPNAADGSKQGVDDYLAAGGTLREMFMLARDFDPADVGRIRMSKDEKLRTAVEDLERRLWDTEWKGMGGASARDVYLKLIETARKSGKLHPDGIRVVKAQGPLALEAKVSTRTLWKALGRLEEWGLIYRDNEGRKPDKSGAFVMRASVSQYGEREADEGNVTPPLQAYDPGDLHLRAPRLMWSSPGYKPRRGTVRETRRVRQSPPPERRPAVKRLGKVRGAILDVLDAGGGVLTLQEIADALHRKRARDIRRRNLPMLEEAAILTVDGDVVTLAAGWLDRLEDARELGGEVEAEELARRRYKQKSRGYHNRQQVEPTHHHVNIPGADGHVEDLERIGSVLSKTDSRTLEAIRAFEDKYGRGAFRWDRASCKELFYSGPIEGFWPEPEELRRIRDYLTAARDVAA